MTSDQLIEWARETVERAAQLPDALARLHDVHGMSYGLIAEATGTRKGTVHKRAKRGRPAPST